MSGLSEGLIIFANNWFSERLRQNPESRLQPVIVGPPEDVLREIYCVLTDDGRSEWTLSGDRGIDVPVLLVNGGDDGSAASRSAECNWHYAVAIRDSTQYCLTLATPHSWDERLVSLENATDTIGHPRLLDDHSFLNAQPWKYLLEQVRAIDTDSAASVLKYTARAAWGLGPGVRDTLVWKVLNDILGASSEIEVCLAAGLPSLGERPLDSESIKSAASVLADLGKHIAREGLESSEAALLEAAQGLIARKELVPEAEAHITQMFSHIQAEAGTAANFGECPPAHFSPGHPEKWWSELTVNRLLDLLRYADITTPTGTIQLDCTNALTNTQPFMVLDEVALGIRTTSDRPAPELSIHRRVGGQYESLDYPETSHYTDSGVPPHDRPLTYKADAPAHRAARISVISLTHFEAGGLALVESAVECSVPKAVGAGATTEYSQEATFSAAGSHEVTIFGRPDANLVEVSRDSHTIGRRPFSGSGAPVSIVLDLEHNDRFAFTLFDEEGSELCEWFLEVRVEPPEGDLPESMFESLVHANRTGSSSQEILQVKPRSHSFRNELEKFLVESENSWRGLLGCWRSSDRPRMTICRDTFTVGTLEVSPDPRPAGGGLPEALLKAREEIRCSIQAQGKSIPELDLASEEMCKLVKDYVRAYETWLLDASEEACWMDTLAVYGTDADPVAGDPKPTPEPVALLISPLHPLRLGWQANAQHVLREALDSGPCVIAGLLDPGAIPGCGALPLTIGGRTTWRSFVASPTDDPYWSCLWNSGYLDNQDRLTQVRLILRDLGIATASLTGGVSRSHAKRALKEVERILPGHSCLKVGLVGSGDYTGGGLDGVLEWLRERFGEEELSGWPIEAHIFDMRSDRAFPDAATLQILLEESHERVKWFQIDGDGLHEMLNLLLLDQVGAAGIRMIEIAGEPPPRSIIATGGLFRLDLRRDSDGAQILEETRVANAVESDSDLGGGVADLAVVFEELVLTEGDGSILEFRPNQHAVETRTSQSQFLAATSGEIDPACFVRGVQSAGAYLWDYELPDIAGMEEVREGYYLIATPTSAVKTALREAASLITEEEIEPEDILSEISMRGIPVLRRFSMGGASTRGELGVLLAVRLIQDVFRRSGAEVRFPVFSKEDEMVFLIMPVDSYWAALKPLMSDLPTDEHPDLIMAAIHVPDGGQTKIRLTPIEVKFRNKTITEVALRKALSQAGNLGAALSGLFEAAPKNELWDVCSHSLLAQMIDHAFRVYANPELTNIETRQWQRMHGRVLQDTLNRNAKITVGESGRVIVFDPSTKSGIKMKHAVTSAATGLVVGRGDQEALLVGRPISAELEEAIEGLGFYPVESGAETPPRGEAGVAGEVEDGKAQPGPGPDERKEESADSFERIKGADEGVNKQETEEGETQEAGNAISEEVRRQVAEAFEGFIGNASAVKRVSNDLLRAFVEDTRHLPKNYLFTGEPSTGKTELARRVARALGLPFVSLDGKGLSSRARLFDLIDGAIEDAGEKREEVGRESGLPVYRYPPLLVFVDEVHLVGRSVQESLLKILESSDRRLLLDTFVADMQFATFLLATTRPSNLDAAFRSRCVEIGLHTYNQDQVAEIVQLNFAHDDWNNTVYRRIAKLGRLVPRVALGIARDLETEITVSPSQDRGVLEHLEEVRKLREIDERGLTRLDREYLAILHSEAKPLGERSILSILGSVDPDRVTEEVEPFLRRLGFITFGPRGRELTPQGRRYIDGD